MASTHCKLRRCHFVPLDAPLKHTILFLLVVESAWHFRHAWEWNARGCTGLLACDESTGTVGTRLEANGMENTEEWRQASAPSCQDGREDQGDFAERLFIHKVTQVRTGAQVA